MYEFCIDYVQLTCGEKVKLCDMDTEVSLYTQKQMIFIKTIHKMLKLDLIFQIMNQIGLYKLGGIIIIKFVLRAKIYNYLIDEGSGDKKAKATKMCHKKKT